MPKWLKISIALLIAIILINIISFGKLSVKSVIAVPEKTILEFGEKCAIDIKVIPSGANMTNINITSSDSDIISISNRSAVAVSHGTALIYTTDDQGNITSNKTEITVNQKKLTKDDLVYVGKTGTKYHYEDCVTLKKQKLSMTLNDAIKEGRTPCSKCNPILK